MSETGKITGFSAVELDSINKRGICDYLIVEADGSAGKSLKFHAGYEPVLSENMNELLAVIGIDILVVIGVLMIVVNRQSKSTE